MQVASHNQSMPPLVGRHQSPLESSPTLPGPGGLLSPDETQVGDVLDQAEHPTSPCRGGLDRQHLPASYLSVYTANVNMSTTCNNARTLNTSLKAAQAMLRLQQVAEQVDNARADVCRPCSIFGAFVLKQQNKQILRTRCSGSLSTKCLSISWSIHRPRNSSVRLTSTEPKKSSEDSASLSKMVIVIILSASVLNFLTLNRNVSSLCAHTDTKLDEAWRHNTHRIMAH